jgi:hypothetical protein
MRHSNLVTPNGTAELVLKEVLAKYKDQGRKKR